MNGVNDPIQVISEAFMSAKLKDLPDMPGGEYPPYMQSKAKALGKYNMPPRRPRNEELELWTFNEDWASTALGYGGMGGNSVTTALTVIVACRLTDTAAIYWGSHRVGNVVSYSEAKEMALRQNTK